MRGYKLVSQIRNTTNQSYLRVVTLPASIWSICCSASSIFSANWHSDVTLFTKPSFNTLFVLSLCWVDVILSRYIPLKYAITHIFRFSHKELIAG
jgi:hypothetical protein